MAEGPKDEASSHREATSPCKINFSKMRFLNISCRPSLLFSRLNSKFFNLVAFQTNQAPAPALSTLPSVVDIPVQGDETCKCQQSLYCKVPASLAKEPTAFIAHSEIEAMLRKKKENASVASVFLDLKPPYSANVAAKPYPTTS